MPSPKLDRDSFMSRYRQMFVDPAFADLEKEIAVIGEVAWEAYSAGRKSPHTRAAGPGFADPSYEISTDWLQAKEDIEAAQARYDDRTGRPRILLINGSARSEHTCPGEMSKSWRLLELARTVTSARDIQVEVLDLSRLASEYGRRIHPCKSCVSTAMPLCHWPCSCYPNHSLGQTQDWMNEIYPKWVEAHGILIVTPVNWYQAPGPLKLMMDRLVCADGGNPDPSSTHGKRPEEARALELAGWPYPRHLAGRLFGTIVHGDTVGAESLRRILMDWASDMHLVGAGADAELDGYIGYYEPYATSHKALDEDDDFRTEVINASEAMADAVLAQRAGSFVAKRRPEPNPK
ncbi:flavodoxin family protein [Roseiarcaceae bacterium H3SJ34-1]|uniref:flavodoxin family protein n=1 Tax=Terripilifer ovatus TaxID=3032367 RepID=UPI003AB97491|nr:flavodoxin family protein [Roseiarcaceae bacterium H3SJ34-1]